MPKFNVTVWYSLPRFKSETVEAANEEEARRIASEWVESEDTNAWPDGDDADVEVYVEKE